MSFTACGSCGRSFETPRTDSCGELICNAYAQNIQTQAYYDGAAGVPDDLVQMAGKNKAEDGGGDDAAPAKRRKEQMSPEEVGEAVNILVAKFTAQANNPEWKEAYERAFSRDDYEKALVALATPKGKTLTKDAFAANIKALQQFNMVVEGSWIVFDSNGESRKTRAYNGFEGALRSLRDVEDKLVQLKFPRNNVDGYHRAVLSAGSTKLGTWTPQGYLSTPEFAPQRQHVAAETERIRKAYETIKYLNTLIAPYPLTKFVEPLENRIYETMAEQSESSTDKVRTERFEQFLSKPEAEDRFWGALSNSIARDTQREAIAPQIAAHLKALFAALPEMLKRYERMANAKIDGIHMERYNRAKAGLRATIEAYFSQLGGGGGSVDTVVSRQELLDTVVRPYLASNEGAAIRLLPEKELAALIRAVTKKWNAEHADRKLKVSKAKKAAVVAAAVVAEKKPKIDRSKEAQAAALDAFKDASIELAEKQPGQFAAASDDAIGNWLDGEAAKAISVAAGMSEKRFAKHILRKNAQARTRLISAMRKAAKATVKREAREAAKQDKQTQAELRRAKREHAEADEAQVQQTTQRKKNARESKDEASLGAAEERAADASLALAAEVSRWPPPLSEALMKFLNDALQGGAHEAQFPLTKPVLTAYGVTAQKGESFEEFALRSGVNYVAGEGSIGHQMAWQRLEQTDLGRARRTTLVTAAITAVNYEKAKAAYLDHSVPDKLAVKVIKRIDALIAKENSEAPALGQQTKAPIDDERATKLYINRVLQKLSSEAPNEVIEAIKDKRVEQLLHNARQIVKHTRTIMVTMAEANDAETAIRPDRFRGLLEMQKLEAQLKTTIARFEERRTAIAAGTRPPAMIRNSLVRAYTEEPNRRRSSYINEGLDSWLIDPRTKKSVYPSYLIRTQLGVRIANGLGQLWELLIAEEALNEAAAAAAADDDEEGGIVKLVAKAKKTSKSSGAAASPLIATINEDEDGSDDDDQEYEDEDDISLEEEEEGGGGSGTAGGDDSEEAEEDDDDLLDNVSEAVEYIGHGLANLTAFNF